ncbi:MAG: serine hydrolase [Lachnospiraceae bacterium]|nr:serine hydrolase [Lachnospiraceae bacterium]
MKKFFTKIFWALTAAVLINLCGLTVTAFAGEVSWPAGPEVTAESAIVIEAATGTVLYEKNADDQHYPASITKIMTTLLALENSSLDETVTFSADAVYKNEGNSSHIARDLDEQMTMEQCLYAVMLESANECAYAVAEHVGGGDYQAFIGLMNEKAAELGCANTTFTNANGLPDEAHVTSCRDMALIAQAAIKNSTFRQIIGTVKYTIPPTNKHAEETILNNHHRMLSSYKGTKYLYEYCVGGKTGYTVAAGNTLVTYAEKDGMLLICVVMQAPSQYEDTTSLFEYCFANYAMYNVAENEMRYVIGGIGSGTFFLFSQAEAFAELDPDAQIILPAAADFSDTEVEISSDPVSAGTTGTLIYSYGGKQVGTADIVAAGAGSATCQFGSGTYVSAGSGTTGGESESGNDGLSGGSSTTDGESASGDWSASQEGIESADGGTSDGTENTPDDGSTMSSENIAADDGEIGDNETAAAISAESETGSGADDTTPGSSSRNAGHAGRIILTVIIIAAAAAVIWLVYRNFPRLRRRK